VRPYIAYAVRIFLLCSAIKALAMLCEAFSQISVSSSYPGTPIMCPRDSLWNSSNSNNRNIPWKFI